MTIMPIKDLLEVLSREIDRSFDRDPEAAFAATETALSTLQELTVMLNDRKSELSLEILYQDSEDEPWYNK